MKGTAKQYHFLKLIFFCQLIVGTSTSSQQRTSQTPNSRTRADYLVQVRDVQKCAAFSYKKNHITYLLEIILNSILKIHRSLPVVSEKICFLKGDTFSNNISHAMIVAPLLVIWNVTSSYVAPSLKNPRHSREISLY